MAKTATLGFPRIGLDRELKKAVEAYWAGKTDLASLEATASELRLRHWKLQADAGIDIIPSNDFAYYDQVLGMTALLGAVPPRFGPVDGPVSLDTYFAMARGTDDAFAMEMTKWFDTNYHYIVPEIAADTVFALSSDHPVAAYTQAKAAGIETRPVLIGPLTYLLLAKGRNGFDPLTALDKVLPVYVAALTALAEAGATAVQMDEPCLVQDLSSEVLALYASTYETLVAAVPGVALTVATYFEGISDKIEAVAQLPVAGLHVDLVRDPSQIEAVAAAWPADKVLSLGLVDGRNIWVTDLDRALSVAESVAGKRGGADNLVIASSCSLLHVPVDLEVETDLDAELKSWMAYARQKLGELVSLAKGLTAGRASIQSELDQSAQVQKSRAQSARLTNPAVRQRLAALTADDATRASDYPTRAQAQRARLNLPPLPTTTIGSFPQTKEVRQQRARWRKGSLSEAAFDTYLQDQIKDAVARQEALGLDMLVHGEFERNDMVEYFGEQLDGFAFTKNGWVQSYGSRCVKPPVIFGDVSRPAPMTVKWSAYAQSLTDKPMKGMLTGPVTILMWSFVRDDQPRADTCRQIALAIRDEVVDLEAAGIAAIQIDEPAYREGLPLKQAKWEAYLAWAVECFRLSASGVRDETQIHTHMCYSEFNDIIGSIADMDADVISIETSRSDMELLDAFVDFKYPNEIGPGVWDIHSPRVPNRSEMINLLTKALQVLPAEKIWVNPDCGLKTRGWPETEASLKHLVEAAQEMRAKIGKKAA